MTARPQAGQHRFGAAAVVVVSALSAGCSGFGHSPREAYAPLPEREAVSGAQRGERFEVLDAWQWTDRADAPNPFDSSARALDGASLGLFPAGAFRLAVGRCEDCAAPALWWFRDEIVAVPRRAPVSRGAGTAAGAQPPDAGAVAPDGADAESTGDVLPLPSLVWLGAPQRVEGARLSADGKRLSAEGRSLPLALPPRIPTNDAYADASSLRFFERRNVSVRGAVAERDGGPLFVARTIWPEDARIDFRSLELEPLGENELLGTLIEAQLVGTGGEFPARLLFERERDGTRDWAGKPVLAFVLSGAQGDDDGARGGHLAVATGTFGANGEWRDWLANNFYPLLDRNAKGIIPASLPMDNYLLDVNSGQLWYRPAYMLVAVLRDARAAAAVQQTLQDTMTRLYCLDIDFDMAGFNSTAMTMDSLRELGWRVPGTGPTSRLAAIAAAPLAAIARLSLRTGRELYNALSAERTRLLPRVAFEVAGHDLLYLAAAGRSGETQPLSAFERMLAEDIEAVAFVRMPQVPSERRVGTYPVRSLLDYGADLIGDPGEYEAAPDAGTRERPGPPVLDACPVGAGP